jgi:hypothetical protein
MNTPSPKRRCVLGKVGTPTLRLGSRENAACRTLFFAVFPAPFRRPDSPASARVLTAERFGPIQRLSEFVASLVDEAITRPIGTPISTSKASDSCRLASTVSGTASVAPSS